MAHHPAQPESLEVLLNSKGNDYSYDLEGLGEEEQHRQQQREKGTFLSSEDRKSKACILFREQEERQTLEEIHKPFLIQEGYLQRTPQGRVLTSKAWQLLGIEHGKNLLFH